MHLSGFEKTENLLTDIGGSVEAVLRTGRVSLQEEREGRNNDVRNSRSSQIGTLQEMRASLTGTEAMETFSLRGESSQLVDNRITLDEGSFHALHIGLGVSGIRFCIHSQAAI